MPPFGFFFPGFFGMGFVLYFLPSIVALARQKRDLVSILLLNFFLGWTAVGWGGGADLGSESRHSRTSSLRTANSKDLGEG